MYWQTITKINRQYEFFHVFCHQFYLEFCCSLSPSLLYFDTSQFKTSIANEAWRLPNSRDWIELHLLVGVSCPWGNTKTWFRTSVQIILFRDNFISLPLFCCLKTTCKFYYISKSISHNYYLTKHWAVSCQELPDLSPLNFRLKTLSAAENLVVKTYGCKILFPVKKNISNKLSSSYTCILHVTTTL